MPIKLDSRNARKHSDRNKAAIKRSLEEVGAGRSILLDADETVIAGNGVYEQAQAMGLPVKVVETDGKELIAVKRTDLSGAKAKRVAMLDNYAADTSAWDYDAEVLKELAKDDELIAELARSEYQLRVLLGTESPIDPNAEWQGMPGFGDNPKIYRTLIVHFDNENDVNDFAQLVKQPITDKTKYIWYPQKDKRDTSKVAFVCES